MVLKHFFNKQGFSLIEVCAVLAIVVILAGFSFVFLKNFGPYLKLSAETKNLSNSLRTAQRLALSQQTNFGIKIFLNENKYQLFNYNLGIVENEEFLSNGVIFSDVLGFSGNEIIFNPYGAVSEAGSIALSSLDGNQKIIFVRPSGFVRTE